MRSKFGYSSNGSSTYVDSTGMRALGAKGSGGKVHCCAIRCFVASSYINNDSISSGSTLEDEEGRIEVDLRPKFDGGCDLSTKADTNGRK